MRAGVGAGLQARVRTVKANRDVRKPPLRMADHEALTLLGIAADHDGGPRIGAEGYVEPNQPPLALIWPQLVVASDHRCHGVLGTLLRLRG